MKTKIRHADNFEDYKIISEISSCAPPLVEHDSYIYWIIRRCLSSYVYILETDKTPIGFLTAVPMSHDKNSIYFWQLGIVEEHRRKGYAYNLVEKAINDHDVNSFEVNIASDNIGSIRVFEKAAMSINKNLVSIETKKEPEMFSVLQKYEESYFITV